MYIYIYIYIYIDDPRPRPGGPPRGSASRPRRAWTFIQFRITKI